MTATVVGGTNYPPPTPCPKRRGRPLSLRFGDGDTVQKWSTTMYTIRWKNGSESIVSRQRRSGYYGYSFMTENGETWCSHYSGMKEEVESFGGVIVRNTVASKKKPSNYPQELAKLLSL